jgi:cytochrome b subunit of formate dehydrogenase/mono/diheme cytochrome c family protein
MTEQVQEHDRKYLRFPLSYRIEHIIVLLSFTILSVTGLVQKFGTAGISQWIVMVLGGLETVRIIHRVAAIVLMVEAVYHIGAAGYHVFVLRKRPLMLPTVADIRNGIQAMRYNLRMGSRRPQQGRYTFEEKFEYWALVWGTVVMIITGWMLWNPIAAASILPGEFIPAAKEVHGGEALLAVLAIIIWHMYHVHIRHFNKSMFTGYMTEEEMLEDHPLELADIKAGRVEEPLPAEEVSRRRRIYLPIYGVFGTALLVGIFTFATFERTAVETVENPRQVMVYAPLTPTPFPEAPPTPTPLPVAQAPTTWEGGIGAMFQNQCASCHGQNVQLGNLNLASYTSALAGGEDGPGIVPGDPEASFVIIIQEAGGHPAQFSSERLELIREWIAAGAPEN